MMFAAAIEADTTLSTKSPEARALAAKLMQKYDRDRNGKVSPSRPPSPARVVAPPPPPSPNGGTQDFYPAFRAISNLHFFGNPTVYHNIMLL